MSLKEKPEPVTDGDFADGPDVMLWNPALTAGCWLKELRRASVLRCCTIHGVAGLVALALGVGVAQGLPRVLLLCGGALAVVCCLCDAAVTAVCLATDHRHRRGRPCRLERAPGEFFLRGRDFADLGEPAHRAALFLIDLTRELHTTTARAWLDPGLPRAVHSLAWAALTGLNRSWPARRHVERVFELTSDAALAAAASAAVDEFDTALEDLIHHVRACVTLTRAWEAKLRHADLVERTAAARDQLRTASIRPLADLAAELPESVFAHITAARDLTRAGPFPWETPAVTGRAW